MEDNLMLTTQSTATLHTSPESKIDRSPNCKNTIFGSLNMLAIAKANNNLCYYIKLSEDGRQSVLSKSRDLETKLSLPKSKRRAKQYTHML